APPTRGTGEPGPRPFPRAVLGRAAAPARVGGLGRGQSLQRHRDAAARKRVRRHRRASRHLLDECPGHAGGGRVRSGRRDAARQRRPVPGHGASRATLLRRLALPASLPSWMIALRLAAAHSVLAAMVAEFLMGTTGLGYLFAATKADLNMERALGTSVVATAVSVTCFLAVMIAERRVRARWAR